MHLTYNNFKSQLILFGMPLFQAGIYSKNCPNFVKKLCKFSPCDNTFLLIVSCALTRMSPIIAAKQHTKQQVGLLVNIQS